LLFVTNEIKKTESIVNDRLVIVVFFSDNNKCLVLIMI
jgi:hypothetical protein